MTSAAKIRANRRNALRSTGPRSPAEPGDLATLMQLWRLDRYERYVPGRRKRAIREFDDATVPMRVAAALATRAGAQNGKTKPTEKRQ